MRGSRLASTYVALLAYVCVLVCSYGHAMAHFNGTTLTRPVHTVAVNATHDVDDTQCSLCHMLTVFGHSAISTQPLAPVPHQSPCLAARTGASLASGTHAHGCIRGPPSLLPI